MVEHTKRSKNSSTPGGYQALCRISLSSSRPENVRLVDHSVTATISEEPLDTSIWHDPPHVALANLITYDTNTKINMKPKPGLTPDGAAAVKFVKQYGFPGRTPTTKFDLSDTSTKISLAEIAKIQHRLRTAWRGISVSGEALRATKTVPRSFSIRYAANGELEISTSELRNLMEVLFVIDYNAKKLGVCKNPDCQSPYFVKNRSTQVVCQQGPCTEYLQRGYALNWWNTEGKKQRTKKQKMK